MTTATLTRIERPVTLSITLGTDTYRLTLDDTDGDGRVILSNSYGWTGETIWPKGSRGDASLLAALLSFDVSYVAGRFEVDEDFDQAATERAVKVALYQHERAQYDDLAKRVRFPRREDYMRWLEHEAPGEEPWHRYPSHTRIRPDFARFYEAAWPLLREKRAEIEAVLYPNGLEAR